MANPIVASYTGPGRYTLRAPYNLSAEVRIAGAIGGKGASTYSYGGSNVIEIMPFFVPANQIFTIYVGSKGNNWNDKQNPGAGGKIGDGFGGDGGRGSSIGGGGGASSALYWGDTNSTESYPLFVVGGGGGSGCTYDQEVKGSDGGYPEKNGRAGPKSGGGGGNGGQQGNGGAEGKSNLNGGYNPAENGERGADIKSAKHGNGGNGGSNISAQGFGGGGGGGAGYGGGGGGGGGSVPFGSHQGASSGGGGGGGNYVHPNYQIKINPPINHTESTNGGNGYVVLSFIPSTLISKSHLSPLITPKISLCLYPSLFRTHYILSAIISQGQYPKGILDIILFSPLTGKKTNVKINMNGSQNTYRTSVFKNEMLKKKNNNKNRDFTSFSFFYSGDMHHNAVSLFHNININ